MPGTPSQLLLGIRPSSTVLASSAALSHNERTIQDIRKASSVGATARLSLDPPVMLVGRGSEAVGVCGWLGCRVVGGAGGLIGADRGRDDSLVWVNAGARGRGARVRSRRRVCAPG